MVHHSYNLRFCTNSGGTYICRFKFKVWSLWWNTNLHNKQWAHTVYIPAFETLRHLEALELLVAGYVQHIASTVCITIHIIWHYGFSWRCPLVLSRHLWSGKGLTKPGAKKKKKKKILVPGLGELYWVTCSPYSYSNTTLPPFNVMLQYT